MADIPAAFEKRLKRYINKVFHVPSLSVCIWSHPLFQLSGEQIVYLLKDLSLNLRFVLITPITCFESLWQKKEFIKPQKKANLCCNNSPQHIGCITGCFA